MGEHEFQEAADDPAKQYILKVSNNITSVGFFPNSEKTNSQYIFSSGEDGTVNIWDVQNRRINCIHSFKSNAAVNSCVMHPNNRELVIGDRNGVIHIWIISENISKTYVPECGSSIQCVAVDNQGKIMAAVTNKGNCYVTDNEFSERKKTLIKEYFSYEESHQTYTTDLFPTKKIPAHSRYALKCKFSPDSLILATTSADKTCKLWTTKDYSLIAVLEYMSQKWVWDVEFSDDSKYVFTASSDNVVRLWTIFSDKTNGIHVPIRKYKENGHQNAVTTISFKKGTHSFGLML